MSDDARLEVRRLSMNRTAAILSALLYFGPVQAREPETYVLHKAVRRQLEIPLDDNQKCRVGVF